MLQYQGGIDFNQQQLKTLVALPDGSNAKQTTTAGYSYLNTGSNSTLKVVTGGGVFRGITTNTGGTGSTAIVYDSTSGAGTVIANIVTTGIASPTYDAKYTNGLTVVTAGAGAANVTILYR